MNISVIIIIVLIVILFYVLFTYFASSSSTLQATADLNGGALPQMPVGDNPKSARYAYGIWVYINTWDNQMEKILFWRNGNIRLFLGRNEPSLYCGVTMQNGNESVVKITDNFPIQKWVQIIVSFDSQFMDCYLNGKLIVSNRFRDSNTSSVLIPATPPDKDTLINLGYAGKTPYYKQDIKVAKFKRWSAPIDPQSAWNSYMEGNGDSALGKWSAYGIDLAVLKNSVEDTRYKLL